MPWKPFSSSARQTPSDLDADDDSQSSAPRGIPVESAEIVMVSPPTTESENDESSPRENYQTPPEDSLPASSDEQRQLPPADDPRPSPRSGGVGPDGTEVVDKCTYTERTVDLGMDSDHLGFSGGNSTLVIDGKGAVFGVGSSRNVESVVGIEGSDIELDKFVVSPRVPNLPDDGISSKPRLKKLKITYKSLKPSEFPAARTVENEYQVNDDLPLKETEVEAASSKSKKKNKHGKQSSAPLKNIEELEKFRYVSPSTAGEAGKVACGVSGQRELPPSVSGEVRKPKTEKEKLRELLEAWVMVARKVDDGTNEDDDFDFLETAMKRGLNFPRPRWWPPEGFDD